MLTSLLGASFNPVGSELSFLFFLFNVMNLFPVQFDKLVFVFQAIRQSTKLFKFTEVGDQRSPETDRDPHHHSG